VVIAALNADNAQRCTSLRKEDAVAVVSLPLLAAEFAIAIFVGGIRRCRSSAIGLTSVASGIEIAACNHQSTRARGIVSTVDKDSVRGLGNLHYRLQIAQILSYIVINNLEDIFILIRIRIVARVILDRITNDQTDYSNIESRKINN